MSVLTDLPASAKELYKPHPSVDADLTSSAATMTWTVPDTDLNTFLNTVAGKTELIGGIGGVVLRVVPLQHPVYQWMYARSFRAVGMGWDTEAQARVHEVTVNFGNLPWPVNGTDAFLSYSSRPDVRTMELPKAGVLIGASTPMSDKSMVVHGRGMSVTVHQLPYLNELAWNNACRCVNSKTFRDIPPGYVQYLGPSIGDSITFAGVRTNEVTHEFSASPILWNQEFDETGTLQDVTVGGLPRYPAIDFAAVLFS